MKIVLEHLKSNKLIPVDYIVALEKFLPMWLESLVPHYQEAKRKEVELLALQNYLCLGTHPILYENNGFGYCLMENKALGGMELAFNADYEYQKVNWKECFESYYPGLFIDETERIINSGRINSYMSRMSNSKQPYNLIAEQVNEYFKGMF